MQVELLRNRGKRMGGRLFGRDFGAPAPAGGWELNWIGCGCCCGLWIVNFVESVWLANQRIPTQPSAAQRDPAFGEYVRWLLPLLWCYWRYWCHWCRRVLQCQDLLVDVLGQNNQQQKLLPRHSSSCKRTERAIGLVSAKADHGSARPSSLPTFHNASARIGKGRKMHPGWLSEDRRRERRYKSLPRRLLYMLCRSNQSKKYAACAYE